MNCLNAERLERFRETVRHVLNGTLLDRELRHMPHAMSCSKPLLNASCSKHYKAMRCSQG